jgi:hypothetical protein
MLTLAIKRPLNGNTRLNMLCSTETTLADAAETNAAAGNSVPMRAPRQRHRLLHRERRAFDVDIEHPVVGVFGDSSEWHELVHPGINEEHVEATLASLHRVEETARARARRQAAGSGS